MQTDNLIVEKVTEFEGKVIIKSSVQFGDPQVITGPGAINLSTTVTHLITEGADAYTLADGLESQQKFIVMKTDGGVGTLTPDNIAVYTSFGFEDVGDSLQIMFTNGKWHFMGGTITRTV